MSRIGFVSAGIGIVVIGGSLVVLAERVLRGPRRAATPAAGRSAGAVKRRRAAARAARR
jgi:tartrate dehydratase alpha subunit/fumarate hydratase class I-like protein